MYGKFIDDILRFAPKKLNGNGVIVYNPPEEMYLEQGWKPVIFTDQPNDPPAGYIYEAHWEEQEDSIIQVWELVELPDDIDDDEAFGIIFGGDSE